MKWVDESTLETIAELVCGSGGGSSEYLTPGPYRSMWEIISFFNRAGVQPQGLSSTRKWFVLESLQSGNGTDDLEKVLLRLASPREYRGDYVLLHSVVEHANRVLRLDGLEIVLIEGEPELREHHSSVGRLSCRGIFFIRRKYLGRTRSVPPHTRHSNYSIFRTRPLPYLAGVERFFRRPIRSTGG